jgi:hypothetical protein
MPFPGFESASNFMFMSKLDDELLKDENLWRIWQEEGVTETTSLAVDVFFMLRRRLGHGKLQIVCVCGDSLKYGL